MKVDQHGGVWPPPVSEGFRTMGYSGHTAAEGHEVLKGLPHSSLRISSQVMHARHCKYILYVDEYHIVKLLKQRTPHDMASARADDQYQN
jgi:hypothetical protein